MVVFIFRRPHGRVLEYILFLHPLPSSYFACSSSSHPTNYLHSLVLYNKLPTLFQSSTANYQLPHPPSPTPPPPPPTNLKMQFTSALLVAFSAVGIMAQNGQRFCAGGGISCEYPKGRCAKVCVGPAAGFATTCDCPVSFLPTFLRLNHAKPHANIFLSIGWTIRQPLHRCLMHHSSPGIRSHQLLNANRHLLWIDGRGPGGTESLGFTREWNGMEELAWILWRIPQPVYT